MTSPSASSRKCDNSRGHKFDGNHSSALPLTPIQRLASTRESTRRWLARAASFTPCSMAPATKPRHSTAPAGFARQRDDQRATPATAASEREQDGVRREFAKTRHAHRLAEARAARRASLPADGLGRHVTRRDARAAGGQDEPAALLRQTRRIACLDAVRCRRARWPPPPPSPAVRLIASVSQGRPAQILVLARRSAVRNGDDADGNGRLHGSSLREAACLRRPGSEVQLRLANQHDVANAHGLINRLAHVVNRQGRPR